MSAVRRNYTFESDRKIVLKYGWPLFHFLAYSGLILTTFKDLITLLLSQQCYCNTVLLWHCVTVTLEGPTCSVSFFLMKTTSPPRFGDPSPRSVSGRVQNVGRLSSWSFEGPVSATNRASLCETSAVLVSRLIHFSFSHSFLFFISSLQILVNVPQKDVLPNLPLLSLYSCCQLKICHPEV